MASAQKAPHRVCDAGKLARDGARLHTEIEGRFVTVLRHRGELYCFDSTCYHAGGPLGNGDIEDVNGEPCVVCPWHLYQVALADGAKYYQPLIMTGGKMKPGGLKKKERAQRTHHVEGRSDGVFVTLNLEGKFDSDQYGGMSTCGGSQTSNKPVHSKRNFGLPQRSGHVLRGQRGAGPALPGMPTPAPPAALAPESGSETSGVSTALAALSSSLVQEEADLDDEENEVAGATGSGQTGAQGRSAAAWTQLVVGKKVRLSDACVELHLDATTLDGADEVMRRLYGIDADFGDGTIVDTEDLFDTRHIDVGLVLDEQSAELTHRPYTPVRSAKRSLARSSASHLFHLEIRVYAGGRLGPRLAALEPGEKVFARPGTTRAGDGLLTKAFPPLASLSHVFLFAGGSGITPILQILQNVLDARARLEVTVICANKSLAHTLGADALRRLAEEASALPNLTLRLVHVLTDAPAAVPSDVEGIRFVSSVRVSDARFLQEHVRVPGKDMSRAVFAWCGPQGFMAALRATLVDELGVPESRCVEYAG